MVAGGISVTDLPPPIQIALSHTAPKWRDAALALFAFDDRLSRVVATVRDPLAAQIRLAWWRDELDKPVGAREHSDANLAAISAHLAGEEALLLALVDGWETALMDPPLSRDTIADLAVARAGMFAFLASAAGRETHAEAARAYGRIWALADFCAGRVEAVERDDCLALGGAESPLPALPYALRGLIILGKLGAACIKRGGAPAFTHRGDAMLALRIGIFGK